MLLNLTEKKGSRAEKFGIVSLCVRKSDKIVSAKPSQRDFQVHAPTVVEALRALPESCPPRPLNNSRGVDLSFCRFDNCGFTF